MIFSAFERLIAFRYLRARRQQGFISVVAFISLIGILLGVATLIIVMAVMNGFRQELLGRILGVNGHVTVFPLEASLGDYDRLVERLRGLNGVTNVVPQIQAQVMVSQDSNAMGALVRGLKAEDLASRAAIFEELSDSALERFAAGEGVLVGRRLAEQLRLAPGDQIILVSPRGNQTVMGTLPRVKAYPIAGLFEVGMYEYDNSFVFMPLADAQLFFRMAERVNAIELFYNDPDQVTRVRLDLVEALGPGFRTVDWQRANSGFFSAIQVERNVMFLILSLIILVAAFNILSGQYMLVKGKGRDIAILRTMGASRGNILRIFFLSGASVGLAGTVAGVALGVAFADNIAVIQGWLEGLIDKRLFPPEVYFLSQVPAEVDYLEVAQVVGMAVVLSFLAPIFPAWRAARLDPVEALRYE
ncbi:MAG TPA: lipoprotein-releasing ABC transporter permease subunit [Kiloniellales bacterium]